MPKIKDMSSRIYDVINVWIICLNSVPYGRRVDSDNIIIAKDFEVLLALKMKPPL
jgi:hypothetical protein